MSGAPGWRAGREVVVRTPMLPMTTLLEWASAPDPRAYLADLLAQPALDEAIFLASPGLHAMIARWRREPTAAASIAVEHSLVKYVARMAGRATPFGTFSGVSAGALGPATSIALAPRSEYRRRTRLDNDYLFVLTDALARMPEVRAKLLFRRSSSLYRIAGMWRYVVAKLDGRERTYELVSVAPTEYLDATLERASTPVHLDVLADALVTDEVTRDEATAFVDELVDSQLLVPELGVFVTGPDPIDGTIDELRAAGVTEVAAALDQVRADLRAIDAGGVGIDTERYRATAKRLETLPAQAELARLFQVDMVKPAGIAVSQRVASELARTIQQLGRFLRSPESTRLVEFRRAFVERYEGREVPLAEALDDESGIGFAAARGPGSEGSPLLEGLAFPGGGAATRPSNAAVDALLLRKLGEALASGATEIEITDADIKELPVERSARYPAAFAVRARLGAEQILFEGMSGPSGAALLGRFCHASSDVEAMVRTHLAAEEALAPHAVFAEIVHLNEGRIGNVICRPVLRGHEIVYLGRSGAPAEQQIGIDDLLVSVDGDRVVLRSRRLGREVFPRLTNAHNFNLRTVGTYKFLAELAGQGTDHTHFSWGSLADAPYLPRVRLGKVVVARATWNLRPADLAEVTKQVRAGDRAATLAAVATLRTARRLPRFVVIAAGDNELPIDLDNPLLAAAFADEVSGDAPVVLRELFPGPDSLVVTGPEGAFANELQLTFTLGEPAPATTPAVAAPAIRRSFGPGSEWLYAKIYAGEATKDRVLRELAPVIREAMDGGAADRWFFIRYQDPDPHLRLRFHGAPERLLREVLPALDRTVTGLVDGGVARKLVLDTYTRETERYGGDRGIELVEQIFRHDSEAVLAIVELLEGNAGADARWRLAVRGMDTLLASLGLDAAARERVYTQGKEGLGREHGATTALWARIGERFTRERAALEQLASAELDPEHDLSPGFEAIAARDAAIAEPCAELRRRDAAGELSPPISDFAWSMIHMHANRILHASHRAQELVLNDFLRRIYSGRRARTKR